MGTLIWLGNRVFDNLDHCWNKDYLSLLGIFVGISIINFLLCLSRYKQLYFWLFSLINTTVSLLLLFLGTLAIKPGDNSVSPKSQNIELTGQIIFGLWTFFCIIGQNIFVTKKNLVHNPNYSNLTKHCEQRGIKDKLEPDVIKNLKPDYDSKHEMGNYCDEIMELKYSSDQHDKEAASDCLSLFFISTHRTPKYSKRKKEKE